MNCKEWLGKFENYRTALNTMQSAIPNFYKHDKKFIESKYPKYYTRLNTIIIEINRVNAMPYLGISTLDIENQVIHVRKLLKNELERLKISTDFDQRLASLHDG